MGFAPRFAVPPAPAAGTSFPSIAGTPGGLRREREGMPSLSPLRGPSHLPAAAASRLPPPEGMRFFSFLKNTVRTGFLTEHRPGGVAAKRRQRTSHRLVGEGARPPHFVVPPQSSGRAAPPARRVPLLTPSGGHSPPPGGGAPNCTALTGGAGRPPLAWCPPMHLQVHLIQNSTSFIDAISSQKKSVIECETLINAVCLELGITKHT